MPNDDSSGAEGAHVKAERRRASLAVLIVVPVVLGVLTGFTYAAVAWAHERAMRRRCHSYLNNGINYACHLYAGDFKDYHFNGPFPPTLGYLFPSYIPDASIFLCPNANRATVLYSDLPYSVDDYTPAMFADRHTDYVYVSGLRDTDPPHYILAFDDEWNHGGEGVHVLLTGGFAPSDRDWCTDLELLRAMLALQEEELAAKGRKMEVLRPPWSSWPDPPAGRRPWYSRRGGRAFAVGAFVGVALALALVVRKVRRGREDGGSGNAE